MYVTAVKRDFVAQHFLFGGDWGRENQPHSHHYAVELQLEGDTLDGHGYMVDIVDIEQQLTAAVDRYRDTLLNDQPAFAELNPSIEHFARILAEQLSESIPADNVRTLTVKIWENEIAWTAYRMER